MNFKRFSAVAAVTSLAFGLAGCGHVLPTANKAGMTTAGAFAAASKRARTAKGGTWTILVHMAANNNLYRFGLEDLNEMEAGLPADGSVNVYVEFKGTQNGDAGIYHIKRDTGMNSNIISEKLYPADVIPSNHNIDSGDAAQLTKFVQWGAKNAPADHTMVAVWDHGSGLFGGKTNPITKGFSWDDTSGNNMHTSDLTGLAGTFKAVAGKNLDIFGFDACLMSHSELAYQMAGSCDFLCASEQLEPGKGWDYTGWLDAAGKGDHTAVAVASALTDTYVKSYMPGGSQTSGRDEVTFAATDINAYMANVLPAMNEFSAAAAAAMGKDKKAFADARAKAQRFYNYDCADIGSFLSLLKASDAKVTAAQEKFAAAYKTSIVREGHTNQFPGATGNVMYFPTSGASAEYLNPAKIAFAKEGWKDFLKAFASN